MKNSIVDYGAFKSLSTDDFLEMMQEGCPVIDIRRKDEWDALGVIEGSAKITFFNELAEYDIDSFLEAFTKVVTHKDQAFILVCAHANRTKSIGEFLGAKLGYKNVYELEGGIIEGWIEEGYPTVY